MPLTHTISRKECHKHGDTIAFDPAANEPGWCITCGERHPIDRDYVAVDALLSDAAIDAAVLASYEGYRDDYATRDSMVEILKAAVNALTGKEHHEA